MWYIYTVGYYLAKKEWKIPTCSNMGGPGNYHRKWNKPDRERQIYDNASMCNLKKWSKWTYMRNRNRSTDIENKLMVQIGKGECKRAKLWVCG